MRITRISPVSFRSTGKEPEKVQPASPAKNNVSDKTFGSKLKSNPIPYVASAVAALAAIVIIVKGKNKGWFSFLKKSKHEPNIHSDRSRGGLKGNSPDELNGGADPQPKGNGGNSSNELNGGTDPQPKGNGGNSPDELNGGTDPQPKGNGGNSPDELNGGADPQPKGNGGNSPDELNGGTDPQPKGNGGNSPDELNGGADPLPKGNGGNSPDELNGGADPLPKGKGDKTDPAAPKADIPEKIMTPIERYTSFAERLDTQIDNDISQAYTDYLYIDTYSYSTPNNGLNNGIRKRARRYKKDFITYLKQYDNDDRIKVKGNTVTLNWYSGHPRLIYTFEDNLNGELISIKECPKDKKGKYRILTFNPKKYTEEKNIHYLEKIEFFDAQTDKLEKSITISDDRSSHRAVIMNPETERPRIILSRTTEPDHFYYELTKYDKTSGKPILKLNTKTNTLSEDAK